jgi:hypothetical protein
MQDKSTQPQGLNISPMQWQQGWMHVPTERRRGVNQNQQDNDLAERVKNMGNLAQRTEVLAQLLSPSGRLHMQDDLPHQLHCFPQSVCWRFPEKV